VQHFDFMHGLQRLSDPRDDINCLFFRQSPAALNAVQQRIAVQQFHHAVGSVVLGKGVVRPHNVGMLQASEHARLAEELFARGAEMLIATRSRLHAHADPQAVDGKEFFDRNRVLLLVVVRFIRDAEAAASEYSHNFVAVTAQCCAGRQRAVFSRMIARCGVEARTNGG
jgi:hypothetical protein